MTMADDTRNRDAVEVQVVGNEFRHDGEQYEHAETLEVEAWQLESYRGKIEPVEEGESESEAASPAVEGQEPQEIVEPPFDPTEMTVSEIEDELDGGDFSEAELLAIYSAEREDEDRTTAVDSIDAHLDDLEG